MRTLIALPILLVCASAHGADLTVRFAGLSGTEGQLMVAVYASEAAYQAKEPIAKARLTASGVVQKVFAGLPAGQYAVSAYHDANLNEKLDRDAAGIPLEAYGFSQNPSVRFGPPSFGAAAVTLKNEGLSIEIVME